MQVVSQVEGANPVSGSRNAGRVSFPVDLRPQSHQSHPLCGMHWRLKSPASSQRTL